MSLLRYPHAFDADSGTVKGSLMYIAIASCGEWVGADIESSRRE